MSSLLKGIDSKFNELRTAIKEERSKEITANGVNSLIIVYPPREEKEYLDRAYQDYGNQHIINISELFVEWADEYGIDILKGALKNYKSTPEVLFNNKKSELKDLFKMIIREIEEAVELDKMPVLVRTGMLYGTHIQHIKILEEKIINKSKNPLLIFYPAEVEENIDGEEEVYFLGAKKSSKYRGEFI